MGFRNTQQQARACRALLATVHLTDLWTSEGPTADALALLANGGHLSSGETVMLAAAFDVWSGDGVCFLARMLHVLDYQRLEAICSLLLAVRDVADSYGAVDRWLARHERDPVYAAMSNEEISAANRAAAGRVLGEQRVAEILDGAEKSRDA